MIALSILNIKEFMHLLLRTEAFDPFLLAEASITTYMTCILDGRPHADFFSPEDEAYASVSQEAYVPFSLVRPACFELIKGKRTPSSFKFNFLLSSENQRRTIASIPNGFATEDITGMYLNLKYQNRQLLCTTGISCSVFSPDKSLEQGWDALVQRFFKKYQIACELLS